MFTSFYCRCGFEPAGRDLGSVGGVLCACRERGQSICAKGEWRYNLAASKGVAAGLLKALMWAAEATKFAVEQICYASSMLLLLPMISTWGLTVFVLLDWCLR